MFSSLISSGTTAATRSVRAQRAAVVLFCSVLALAALASRPKQASADWVNYAPTSVSNGWYFDLSSYSLGNMGSFVLDEDQTGINYVKVYPHDFGGALTSCPNLTIALYSDDFATTSVYYYPATNPYVNGYGGSFTRLAWYGSYLTSSQMTDDGGCAYGLRQLSPSGATSSVALAAGTYWYLIQNSTSVRCQDDEGNSVKCLRLAGDAGGTGESQYYRYAGCGASPCNDVQKKGSNGIGEASIGFLTATTTEPTPTYESSTVPDAVVCTTLDIGCYFQQALVFTFYPTQSSVEQFGDMIDVASTTWPFAYAFELPALVESLYPSATTSFSISVPFTIGNATTALVILSTDMLEAVPFASTIRTILEAIAYFLTALTVYALVTRAHNANTHTV